VWYTLLSARVRLPKTRALAATKGQISSRQPSLSTMSGIKCLAMRAGVLCFHDGQLVADRRRGTLQMLKVRALVLPGATWQ